MKDLRRFSRRLDLDSVLILIIDNVSTRRSGNILIKKNLLLIGSARGDDEVGGQGR